MKDMRAQAKSGHAARLARITGSNPVASAATKYATNDSGQAIDTQKVPTRANGGMVTGDSAGNGYARGGMTDDVGVSQMPRRLDRPQRVSVIAGPRPGGGPGSALGSIGRPMGPGGMGGIIDPTGMVNGGGDPVMGGPMGGRGNEGGGMGNPAGIMPPVLAGPTPIPRPVPVPRPMPGTVGGGGVNTGPMAPPMVGGGLPGAGGSAIGLPIGRPPMGQNPMIDPQQRMAMGSMGFKRGGAVKGGLPKPGPGEKISAPIMNVNKPVPAAKGFPAAPKGGAGGGLGRLQDAAAQKKK